jgi:hypothetical protein
MEVKLSGLLKTQSQYSGNRHQRQPNPSKTILAKKKKANLYSISLLIEEHNFFGICNLFIILTFKVLIKGQTK